jgi:DegV family protein with EDD domain
LGHSVEETLQAIRDHIPKTKTFAILYDLRYAVRGGRLPKWLRFMADLMHMTPIIRIKPNGKIGLGGCWMGRRNRAKRLARFVARYYAEEAAVQISVGHASCIEDAKILADELGSVIPHSRDVNICDLGTAIGVHGGPGTLIVSIRPFESVHGVPSGDN